MKKNIVLIFGGKSVEHDISIITALQTMKYVPKEYNLIPVYIEKNGCWCMADNLNNVDTFLNFEKNVVRKKSVGFIANSDVLYVKTIGKFRPYCKVDCALMCLHGGEGENGNVASLLSVCGIPYTSSSPVSSAICMDKIFTKLVLSASDIKNVPFAYFTRKEYEDNKKAVMLKAENLGYPLIIKPANLGSSVAIDVARNKKEFEEMVNIALEFDNKVLLEKYLEGCEEYNCACLTIDGDLLTSQVIKVDKSDIFTFEEKYIENVDKKQKKCNKNMEKRIKTMAKEVYNVLGCSGIVRVDFLFYEDEIYVNEVNTIPGSLSVHMFNNISKKEIIGALIKNAIIKNEEKKHLNFHFESEALSIFKSAVDKAKVNK